MVFQPTEAQMNGGGVAGSPRLPAVVVEDMTLEGPESYDGEDVEMVDGDGQEAVEKKEMEVKEVAEELEGRGERKAMLHTMRPPMDDDY